MKIQLLTCGLLGLLLAGCTTSSTITEFDAEGRVIKTVITEKDPFDKVTEATKGKTVVMWSNGWAGYVSLSTATTEDPTPTGKAFVGKVAKGYISMLPSQKNADAIAKIIMATREDLSINKDGVTATADK